MGRPEDFGRGWRLLLIWGVPAALTLLPLFAIRLADEDAWRLADLPFALFLIGAVGLAFETALRVPTAWTYRLGALLVLGTTGVLTWGNLAVGFAGGEDEPINRIMFAIPAFVLIGSLAVGFRPGGLAILLAGAAGLQIAAGVLLLYAGRFTGPLTVAFTGLWLASALAFLRCARAQSTARPAG